MQVVSEAPLNVFAYVESLKALWVIGLNSFSYLKNYLYIIFSLFMYYIIHILKKKNTEPLPLFLKK